MNLIIEAAHIIFEPTTFLLMLVSVAGGLIIGAIPGLNATMAMALIVPLTFMMDGNQAFAILCSVYVGAISGGLYSAALLGIPGTPSSIATTFDAFPLARKGQAAKVIGIGLISSFIGGTISFIFLSTMSPALSRVAIKFGPPEYFAVTILGLSTVASVIGSSKIKGLIACLLGLSASIVGLDLIVGVPRFTFGFVEVLGGFDLIAVLIGMFAIPQIMEDVTKPRQKLICESVKRVTIPFKELSSNWFNFIRSSIIGTWIGLLPGAGGSIASLLAYDQARQASKNPEKFGKGAIEGVVASETANNAVIGGSIIPLLTLGIPGDTPAAVLIAALLIHGLRPGPMLFETNLDAVYTIFLALYVSNIMMIIIAFLGAKYIINSLSLPKYLILPIVISMCFVGTYALNQRLFDVWVMIGFGLLGYIMNRYRYPVAPFVLGVVLGPIIEYNLRTALQISITGFTIFFARPLSAFLLILVFVSFLWPIIKPIIKNRSKGKKSEIEKEKINHSVKIINPLTRANRITGIFLIILSFLIYWRSGFIAQTSIESPAYGPSFYPRVLSITIIILSTIMVIFPDQDRNIEKKEKVLPSGNVKSVLLAIVLILYVIFIPIIGFVTTTILFLLSCFYYLGTRNLKSLFRYSLISVVLSLSIYYIFETYFLVFLPHGCVF